MNFGLLNSTLLNANRDTKKRPEPYAIDEAMLKFGPSPKKKDNKPAAGAMLFQHMKMMAARMAKAKQKQ